MTIKYSFVLQLASELMKTKLTAKSSKQIHDMNKFRAKPTFQKRETVLNVSTARTNNR